MLTARDELEHAVSMFTEAEAEWTLAALEAAGLLGGRDDDREAIQPGDNERGA